MVLLSQKAADHIKRIQAETDSVEKHLRIAVVGGGCSGSQYQLGFDKEYEGDSRFDSHGITVLVDSNSLAMVDGMEIDYVDGLNGASFVFSNPNAKKGCGCGKSFSC